MGESGGCSATLIKPGFDEGWGSQGDDIFSRLIYYSLIHKYLLSIYSVPTLVSGHNQQFLSPPELTLS